MPYEPVRQEPDYFNFSMGQSDIRWTVMKGGIEVRLCLSLPKEDTLELWQMTVTNTSGRTRKLSIYPYFPTGYMSWMNQEGHFHQELNGIVCSSVTPYQKVADYFKNKYLKDKTFFLANEKPDFWEAQQEAFEGEGGLQSPSALSQPNLNNGDALYETPACITQFQIRLADGLSQDYKFIFGPAYNEAEIAHYKATYLDDPDGFSNAANSYQAYIAQADGFLNIDTPDKGLDNFVNHWLAR